MPLPRMMFTLLACSALAVPVTASLLEDASGHLVSYQFDGGSHHDAPDACAGADPEWSLPWLGSTDGLLVPPDDGSDSFVLDVPTGGVGQRLAIDVTEAAGTPQTEVLAYAPGCIGTVFDPLNLPRPPPSPPAPGPGESQRSADRLDDPTTCYGDAWVFWAERVGNPGPASIHVAWTDGSERTVPLAYQWGPQAFYVTDHALGTTLKGAWINAPTGWDGRFELFAGPCDATHGGAVYGEPPSLEGGLLSFTPVRAGPHVVVVRLASDPGIATDPAPCAACLSPVPVPEPGHAVEPIVDSALAGQAPAVPRISIAASCHYCTDAPEEVVGRISYVLATYLRTGA